MNVIKKINQSLGFTQNEGRIVIFLVGALIVGGALKLFMATTHVMKRFDYSVSDSTFAAKSQMLTLPESTIAAKKETLSQSKYSKYPNPFGSAEGEKGKVRLNTATKEQLMTLPGVGEATANMILEYRKQHGPLKSLDDLENIHGIGSKKLERLRPFLTL